MLYCHHVVRLWRARSSYLHRQDSTGVLQTVRNLRDLLGKHSRQIASWWERSNARWNPILLLISVYSWFFGGVFGGGFLTWILIQNSVTLHIQQKRKGSRVQKRMKKSSLFKMRSFISFYEYKNPSSCCMSSCNRLQSFCINFDFSQILLLILGYFPVLSHLERWALLFHKELFRAHYIET